MSRTQRILGGTGIAYMHQGAVLIAGLWLTPFLLGTVGQDGLGLWLVAGQIIAYLTLLDLGVIAILPREVAFAAAGKDRAAAERRIGGLMARVRQIVRWQLLGLSAASLVVWWLLPADWDALRWPLAIVFAAFVALYPTRAIVAALQGVQDLAFLSKTQFAAWVLSTVITIVLVVSGAGLYALALGWLVSMGVPAAAAVWRARGRWRHQPPDGGSQQPARQYFRRSVWVSVGQVAQVLLNGSDVLLLGRILGAGAVVPYACTGKLVTVFAHHPQLLMHAAQPALTELRVSASKDRLATVATALTQAMLMMSGALAVVILSFNQFFVGWWVGPDQYGGKWLTIAFILMMLLRHWNIASVYTLFCFGYERQISLTGLFDGILTAGGTALFVWKWGPIGAPVASIAGVVLVSLPLNVRAVAHEMGLTVRGFLAAISPLLLRVVAIGALASALSAWFDARSLGGALLVAGPVAALYAAAVLPLAWTGPVGPYIRMALPRIERAFSAPRRSEA